MEFFERAHVVKRKTDNNVKKQLKQMLHGYKVSDNKLIQKSAESKHDFDDSTSVSGFSDLNLTNSSCEDNVIERGISMNDGSNITDISQNLELSSINDVKTIFSEQEDITSLSEELGDNNKLCETESSICDSEMSLTSENILDSDLESSSSDIFDANGELAMEISKKILKLGTKKNKTSNKRKYNEIDTYDSDRQSISTTNENELSELQLNSDDNEVFSNEQSAEDSDIESNPISPPFISITAMDMPHQELNDILGDYKYSTIRNVPSDNQQTILLSSNLEFLAEESMSVDVHTEDEIDSLIPELDDTPAIEEIDELINFDTTADSNLTETVIDLEDTEDSRVTIEGDQMIELQNNVDEIFKIYYSHKGCIIVLKHPSKLFIQGKVKIRRLGGTLEIFGYTLKDDFYNLYAPYYNFAQCVKTVEDPNAYYGLFGKLTSSGLSVAEAEDIVTSVGNQDGIILLQSLNNTRIEFLENNFNSTYLFVKSNKLVEPYFKSASDNLKCSLYSIRPFNSFREHPSWKEAVIYAERAASRGIVCGGKGVGKSTYLRYQVNKLLAKGPVLVVDLDPGQCEFTVAGNISATVVTQPLLGPNFTHLKKPEIMLNIGMINTMDNSKRYLSAVHALLTQCHENKTFSNMQWIVNTMGMTTTLGLKFMTYIIIATKPSYLLQYESKHARRRFDTLLQPHIVKSLYEEYKKDYLFANISCPLDLDYSFVVAYDADSSEKDSFSLTAKDERYLNFLAYFGQLAAVQKKLLGITPYQVSIKDLYIGTNIFVKAENIAKVINGKIVALCQQKQCDSARVFTLADKPLLCHGHGLIRGIDWEKEILYVITPVQSSDLRSVDTLMYADWVPDLVGQEGHLPEGTMLPYHTHAQDQLKQLMSTPRRRFNPLQLLKVTRSAKIESFVN